MQAAEQTLLPWLMNREYVSSIDRIIVIDQQAVVLKVVAKAAKEP